MKVVCDAKVRFAYVYDFKRITEIANSDGFTWDSNEILTTLKEQWTIAVVAVSDEDCVVGFCIYNLGDKTTYAILHIAVDPDFYRQRIGTAILDKMKEKLNNSRTKIVYHLPETNLRGQLFLKNTGFKGKLLRSDPEDIIEFTYEKE